MKTASLESLDHYDFMDLPDYPEPPEYLPTYQLNYEEYDLWREALREFWKKHNIPISKHMIEDFAL